MPLTIPDDVLQQAGMTEQEARIEVACRLFDAEKLDLWQSAQFAELSRTEFEGELVRRGIPVYRYTMEDLKTDLATLEKIGLRERTATTTDQDL